LRKGIVSDGSIGESSGVMQEEVPHPLPSGAAPPVVFWFKMYAGFLCLLYLLVAAFGVVFLVVDPAEFDMEEVEARIIGIIYLILLPFFLRPRPWVWIYDLVIICIGMTSACMLPACIPLLLFWLKPEAKAYFGRV
jgi:hypothetical protein